MIPEFLPLTINFIINDPNAALTPSPSFPDHETANNNNINSPKKDYYRLYYIAITLCLLLSLLLIQTE